MTDTVHASGGLVVRPDGDTLRVLVVHRPKYDDWSLPKGKDEPGEDAARSAVREVEEETGVRAKPVADLGEVSYRLADGRLKVVRYFAMVPITEKPFDPNEEVDGVRWLPVSEAATVLTYERDRRLLRTDLSSLVPPGRVYLVRHAHAGDRHRWEGDDRLRPLSERGFEQAEAIARVLSEAGVDRIVSSPYLRCVQTVEPLARMTHLPVEECPGLGEGSDWKPILSRVEAAWGINVVACSHGDLIPALVEAVARRGARVEGGGNQKGAFWELEVDRGRVVTASYHPPP